MRPVHRAIGLNIDLSQSLTWAHVTLAQDGFLAGTEVSPKELQEQLQAASPLSERLGRPKGSIGHKTVNIMPGTQEVLGR